MDIICHYSQIVINRKLYKVIGTYLASYVRKV